MPKQKRLQPISNDLVIDRLRFENPWWVSGTIDEDYATKKHRLYFSLFQPLVQETDVRRAVVLMGPRRVGKTVMMHHSIADLLRNGITQKKICFINIENPIYNNVGLEQLFFLARSGVGDPEAEGWYVFFDEIQYLKDWEVHLKVLVDSYPKTKFVVSGSAAAALKMKSTESGAGRFTEFMLPPLTFIEYISLKNLDELIIPSYLDWNGNVTDFFSTIDIKLLNQHFVDYLNFGGYPEVIFSDTIRSNPGRYIRSDIVDKVLLRDLPSLYGIQDVQELNSLFTTLAYHTGQEASLDALSKASGVEKYQLKKYLEYLESAFLIRTVHRVDECSKRFKRANFFKIFLTNPSLRSALFTPIPTTDDLIGNMVETAIFSQWIHREWFTPYYARWKNGEVDMVGLDQKNLKPQWALEIKWSNRFFNKPHELKSIINYCKKNRLTSALVTTIDKEGKFIVDDITLYFVPASIYAYVVGNNTLQQKQHRSH
jgi:predicted AAA+ superfamily ATPase